MKISFRRIVNRFHFDHNFSIIFIPNVSDALIHRPGVLFAFLASMESLAVFLSPIIFQPLYAASVDIDEPGLPFLVAGGLGIIAAIFGM